MRPRTPCIAAKGNLNSIHNSSESRDCLPSRASSQDGLKPQFDVRTVTTWVARPGTPNNHVAVEDPADQQVKERSKLLATLGSLQDCFNCVTFANYSLQVPEFKRLLSALTIEEAANVICTAATQRSCVVRQLCSLLCKDDPRYAKLVIAEFQLQFERRRFKNEVHHQYTLNCIEFMVHLYVVQVIQQDSLESIGEALISDMLMDGQCKDQPLDERQFSESREAIVRLLMAVSTIIPDSQVLEHIEKSIEQTLGILPLRQLREQVSRARSHSSLLRPAQVAAAALVAAAAAAASFPFALRVFPFFPFDALSNTDPPQDCISKISDLLSQHTLLVSKGCEDSAGEPSWPRIKDHSFGLNGSSMNGSSGSNGSSTLFKPPTSSAPTLFWANGFKGSVIHTQPVSAQPPAPGCLSLPAPVPVTCTKELQKKLECNQRLIEELRMENRCLRQIAEERDKEQRIWQTEKARLEKEIRFQKGSITVLREANASLTHEVQELKVLGNRLLKEMKQKIINGYNGASSDLSTSELTAPSSA